MLDHYFLRPSTVDRIRANLIGPLIERYVEWMRAQGYADRNVFQRVPVLCHFGDFAKQRGSADATSAMVYVDEFVDEWQALHGSTCKTSEALDKVARTARNPLTQMFEVASHGGVVRHRTRKPFPFDDGAPGFATYLRDERGLREATIERHGHYLSRFAEFLNRVDVASLAALSPPLLAAFIVDRCPLMGTTSRRDLCGTLRIFLRYCHRERLLGRDLSGAVEMPQTYRLADVPRSITWDDVRRMLERVDRRTDRGRRDYAIMLLLVTYGLRAHEVAKLTLDDIDWKLERFTVPQRKAGHWSAYPLARVVGDAIVDYLKNGRPQTADRHMFFRVAAPRAPITSAAISSSASHYLRQAGVDVRRPGAHTLRHTCVQRLIDAEFSLKTVGDYVGHRSSQSTEIYTKVALAALREVAMGDGEAL